MKQNFIDRAIAYVSPVRALARTRARGKMAAAAEARNFYEAASLGHRSAGWRLVNGDVNAEAGPAQVRLRQVTRGLLQNNAYAVKGLSLLVDNIIGSGIEWKVTARGKRAEQISKLIDEHFLSTAIDADGINNIFGLQGLITSTVISSGSALIRRRLRRPDDGYPLPFQIQVLEPDFIDTSFDGELSSGNYVVQGVEYDLLGNRVAWYLFDRHPGSTRIGRGGLQGKRVSAQYVREVFRVDRPGQVHGVTWFTPVIMRVQDLGDYTDAELVRQKIAACYAAFVTSTDDMIDTDGTTSETGAPIQQFEPGTIERLRPGEQITFGTPPRKDDFTSYHKATVREIATGLGVPYESLAGDLENVSYSGGRMGRIDFYRAVSRAQWQTFIPQICGPVQEWTGQAVAMRTGSTEPLGWEWTPPPPELMDPDTEISASIKKIRNGLSSRQEEARKLGMDVVDIDAAIVQDNERADLLGLVFDADPRKRTINGVPTDKINPNDPAESNDPEPGATGVPKK